MRFMRQFQVKDRRALLRDLWTGVVVGLLSVPLSMGYAWVAGLPPQYGLYGSLSVLAFSLITSSPRCFFGVDAAPAALSASILAAMGVAAGSGEAAAAIPVITLMAAAWLFLFWRLGLGRFGKFVSEPVLGGCVTGIATVVALSTIPGLFGGSFAWGRAPALIAHIFQEAENFNPLSFFLGVSTVAVILYGRRKTRVSLSAVMMLAGILLTLVFHVDRYGVDLSEPVARGLPGLAKPDFSLLHHHGEALILETLAVALVIAAETLVSTREVGRKYGDRIDPERELLAYAAGNLAAGLLGSSPVIGSLSRTNRANWQGVSSQWMSVSAFALTGLLLLFATPLLSYVPVPILTGIVTASLVTIMDFPLAAQLWKLDRPSAYIFAAAFAVEILGLAEGVLTGVFLSFAFFTMRASAQPSYFLGRVEGQEGFFDLAQTPDARPLRETVLYQFNGPLFFATEEDFEREVLAALRPDTRLVVVTGVTAVFFFAAERLAEFYRDLKERGITLYLVGQAAAVVEQLTAYGAEDMVREGAVHPRLTEALAAGGLSAPYPLEEREKETSPMSIQNSSGEQTAVFLNNLRKY